MLTFRRPSGSRCFALATSPAPLRYAGEAIEVHTSNTELRIAFLYKSGCGSFDAFFERLHEFPALQSGRDRGQEFEYNAAALLQETTRPGPEEPGVQGHGYAGDVEQLIQRGDAGLVIGWCADSLSCSFRKDDDA